MELQLLGSQLCTNTGTQMHLWLMVVFRFHRQRTNVAQTCSANVMWISKVSMVLHSQPLWVQPTIAALNLTLAQLPHGIRDKTRDFEYVCVVLLRASADLSVRMLRKLLINIEKGMTTDKADLLANWFVVFQA